MMEFPWEEEAQDGSAQPTAPAGEPAGAGTGPAVAPGSPAEAEAQAPGAAAGAAAPGPGTDSEDATDAGDEGREEASEETVGGADASERAGVVGAAEQGGTAVKRADAGSRPVVRKEYYAISEVSELVGLPAHVLRYWESQFSVLNPSKNRSGNRVYQRKEIKLILLVKKLLHEDKYTVEGAKQKLDQLRRGGGLADAAARALDDQTVAALRDELQALDELLRVEVEAD